MSERHKNSKFLTRDDILRAYSKTLSNRAAARYLGVSFFTLKKYAKTYIDEKTGKTLWEIHKNPSGRGIPKFLSNEGKEPPLLDIIEGRTPIYHFDAKKIKHRLIFEGLIDECCAKCGFAERRVTDFRIPLILHFKDRNKTNFGLNNLELLCYNCSFLYATSPITDDQVDKMEDYMENRTGESADWELDEYHLEHLKSLGLYKDAPDPGSEYISRE
jgi:hypothetical protein